MTIIRPRAGFEVVGDDIAARKLPELDRHIAQAQALREAVADCLECGCMNFDRCLLLDATATP